MAPILEMEVECGEQKSRLLRGMVVLRGTVNYCTSNITYQCLGFGDDTYRRHPSPMIVTVCWSVKIQGAIDFECERSAIMCHV